MSCHGNRPTRQMLQVFAIQSRVGEPAMGITMKPIDHTRPKRMAQFVATQGVMAVIMVPQMTVADEDEERRAETEIEVRAISMATPCPTSVHKHRAVR